MDTRVITKENGITMNELRKLASEGFGNVIKATVDVRQGIMAVAGELHAEQEELLIKEHGAERKHTWGINLYPDEQGDDFIEFDSMINLKPNYGNNTRGVDSEDVRTKIKDVVATLIHG